MWQAAFSLAGLYKPLLPAWPFFPPLPAKGAPQSVQNCALETVLVPHWGQKRILWMYPVFIVSCWLWKDSRYLLLQCTGYTYQESFLRARSDCVPVSLLSSAAFSYTIDSTKVAWVRFSRRPTGYWECVLRF